MIPNPKIDPSQTTSPEALRDIGRAVVHAIDRTTRIYRESPPEATLGSLVRFAVGGSSAQAIPVEVQARERVVLPTRPEMEVELDLVIRHTATKAVLVVETDGWKWHRRTPDEHDREIRRDRQIRRYYPHLLRYSADEILQDPWSVLLDILDCLGTLDAFADVEVATGRMVAEACAAPAGDGDREAAPDDPDPVPLCGIEYLRDVAAALPAPPPTDDPVLQRIRRDYPRMYAHWSHTEVEVLREAFLSCVEIDAIAHALGRTVPAVWKQLRRMGMID